jgi:lysophospholipase L1-like esterase
LSTLPSSAPEQQRAAANSLTPETNSRRCGRRRSTEGEAMTRRRAIVVLLCSVATGDLSLRRAAAQPPNPGLPKVVLVGDSIRLSYASVVAGRLKGKAVVVSPPANGGDSGNVLKNLDVWVIRERPAVVHFNSGIHDSKKFNASGKHQVAPEQYDANLRRIVERIRAETDAVVLFATTTPIIDDRAAAARRGRDYKLLEASVAHYNTIAGKVLRELKVPVNDLHAGLVNPTPPQSLAKLIGADGVHLSPAAQQLLGRQVAEFVLRHIPPGE